MARILTDEQLSHLTIPRLQQLLKASRARANHLADLWAEGEINGDDLEAHFQYVDRIKARLKQLQQGE